MTQSIIYAGLGKLNTQRNKFDISFSKNFKNPCFFYQFLSFASLALQVSRDCKTNSRSSLERDARPLSKHSNHTIYLCKFDV